MRQGIKLSVGAGILLLGLWGVVVWAQTAAPDVTKSDAEVQKENLQAQALFEQQNFMGALPLFEDLHKQRPESNTFRERLAMSLLGKATTDSPADAGTTRERARKLLLEAKAAGDNSDLVQIVLEKLSVPTSATARPPSPGAEALAKAEKAFTSGDLKGAVGFYKEAAEADPKLYEAPLFAGDTEYKLKNYDEAGVWFAKAIAIDPNRETAYRYWGDTLMHKGDQKAAQSRFTDAVIAEPYTKATWIGLKQWADATHVRLSSPQITLPKQPVPDAKGNVNVTIDPSTMSNGTSGAWLIYSMTPMMWRKTEFKKHYPSETVYRHSLDNVS